MAQFGWRRGFARLVVLALVAATMVVGTTQSSLAFHDSDLDGSRLSALALEGCVGVPRSSESLPGATSYSDEIHSDNVSNHAAASQSSRIAGAVAGATRITATSSGWASADASSFGACGPPSEARAFATLTLRGEESMYSYHLGGVISLASSGQRGEACASINAFDNTGVNFIDKQVCAGPATAPSATILVNEAGTASRAAILHVNTHTTTGLLVAEGSASASADASWSLTLSLTPAPPTTGRFDWSMPERFGADNDGDGMVDYFEPDGTLDVTPDGWRVDFTDGLPSSCDSSLSRIWLLDGVPMQPPDPGVIFYNPHSCMFSYSFPDEGVYPISLEVRNAAGLVIDFVTKEVVVQDWLIVSLGDSVASGEGNPDIGAPAHRWQNKECHRSAFAGPARAAALLAALDPRTSVTFVHLACSGATMAEVIDRSYGGQEPTPARTFLPQIVQVDQLVGDREIDAVTLSVGANDVEFSTIVQNCFMYGDVTIPPFGLPVTPECHVPGHPFSSSDFFDARVGSLAGNYDRLGARLAAPDIGLPRDRVYITEYFDPTRDETGAFCDQEILEEAFPVPLLGISAAEAQWASTQMLTRLNAEVQGANARNGWNYVGGIYSPFSTHGYCSSQRWIIQITESFQEQKNKDGTIHPNLPGHALYGSRLSGALVADLYVGGDLAQPRHPV